MVSGVDDGGAAERLVVVRAVEVRPLNAPCTCCCVLLFTILYLDIVLPARMHVCAFESADLLSFVVLFDCFLMLLPISDFL